MVLKSIEDHANYLNSNDLQRSDTAGECGMH